MGFWPDPIFTLRDLMEQVDRFPVFWNDFLSWPNDATEPGGFGWLWVVTSTNGAEMVNTGEGGYAAVGSVSAGAGTWSMRSQPDIASGAQSIFARAKNPRITARLQFAPPNAAITAQAFGLMPTGTTFDSMQGGAIINAVGLTQGTTGNLFFFSADGAGLNQFTDLGVPPVQVDKWEIRTDDLGVTWQCYKNDVQVASNSTRVPGADMGSAQIGMKRTAGAHMLQLDYAIGGYPRL